MIRAVSIGAAPLGKDSQDRLRNLLEPGATVNQVWGMTKLSCIASIFYFPEDDTTSSVGRLILNIEAKKVALTKALASCFANIQQARRR
jgi:long-subunit acyl-CoA synthetase (AMP-forming)